MAEFDPAFRFMISHEGDYSNDPCDAGGETKYGISRRSYPDLDIANLGLADAYNIYFRDWWEPQSYKAFDSQLIANKTFDMAVNLGTSQAHKLLQGSCNDMGRMLNCDGILGPLTVSAVNSLDEMELLQDIRIRMRTFYLSLAAKKPSNARFLKGWLARAAA